MSGHNRWSKLKNYKGAIDAKRGKIFTKVIREITVSARLGGGDPSGNPRLRRAMDDARANNMSSENVTRAIKKGLGELEGASYEELTYEGVGPAGVLFLIDVVTDNRNRTGPELRKIFDVHNGVLGAAGSAAWAFEEKGMITLPKSAATEEQLFEIAVGAGAEDVQDHDEQWAVIMTRANLEPVRAALEAAKVAVTKTELVKLPKNKKVVDGRDAEVLMNLTEALEDHDDTQNVFSDFELSEAALTALNS